MSYRSSASTGSEQPVSSGDLVLLLNRVDASEGSSQVSYSPVSKGTGSFPTVPKRIDTPPYPKDALRKDAKAITAQREQSGRLVRECKELLAMIIEATDVIEISNHAHQVIDNLQQMWEQRNNRENEWGDLLNILQICLPKESVETLPREKWEGILKVLDECMGLRTVTRLDMDRGLRILKHAGFDPWKGISGLVE